MNFRRQLNRAVLLVLGGLLPLLASSCVVGPCGFTWIFETSTGGIETLPAAKYDAAEAVYWKFLPGGGWPDSKADFVYCLSYGNPSDALPADFMARFPGPEPRVSAGSIGLIHQPGVLREWKTNRDVVSLSLKRLSIDDNRGTARIHYATGSLNVEATLQLAKRDGRWSITKVKEKERTYF